jgi:hypothetical protein
MDNGKAYFRRYTPFAMARRKKPTVATTLLLNGLCGAAPRCASISDWTEAMILHARAIVDRGALTEEHS